MNFAPQKLKALVATLRNATEVLKVIKMLSLTTLTNLEYISNEDLTHTDVREVGIKKSVPITKDLRYPKPNEYPVGAENSQGEIEMIGDTEVTHWYAEAEGALKHFVAAADPNNEPLIIVHGFPES